MPPGCQRMIEKIMSQNLRGCIFDFPEPGLLLNVEDGTSGAEYGWVQLLPSLTHSFTGVNLYRANSTVRSDEEALYPLPARLKRLTVFASAIRYPGIYISPLNVSCPQ